MLAQPQVLGSQEKRSVAAREEGVATRGRGVATRGRGRELEGRAWPPEEGRGCTPFL